MPLRVEDRPPSTADLVIVGGGVVGAATAFHAAEAGLRPVLVEARPALATLTTPVSAGAFRLQFDDRQELELVRETVDLFLDFEERTGQGEHRSELRQQGYLWLATTGETARRQRGIVERLHGWGQADIEVLDGDEVRGRFPYVGPDVLQARFRAGDGFVDTKRLTYGLAVGAACPVVLDCRVTGFGVDRSGLSAIRTTRGAIRTRTAVVAAGPLTGPVAALAGLDLPLATVRRQKLWVPGLDLVPQDAPMTIDEETGAHWRPAFGGAWALFTDPSTPPSEPTEVVPVDPSFAFRLLDPRSEVSLARVVPFWRDVWEDGAPHWLLQAGQYTMTPDHKPVIGPTAIDGLWVNGGYSGHGIMLGPAGGRILVDLMTGRIDGSSNPFAPDRAFEARPAALL